jgi:hypothetical protein
MGFWERLFPKNEPPPELLESLNKLQEGEPVAIDYLFLPEGILTQQGNQFYLDGNAITGEMATQILLTQINLRNQNTE